MRKSKPPEKIVEKRQVNDVYYAVIDTNVLVSALLSRMDTVSAPTKIVEYLYQGQFIPVYNNEILEEYSDVLNRAKFHFHPSNVETLISQIKKMGIHADKISSGEKFIDLDDAVFFEVAFSHRKTNENTYLVTGNIKHFPMKPFVVSPRQMVNILEGNSD